MTKLNIFRKKLTIIYLKHIINKIWKRHKCKQVIINELRHSIMAGNDNKRIESVAYLALSIL